MEILMSVGIDIGTSTTQLVFSKLAVENTSAYFSVPQVSIVDKEIVYKSPIYATPLATTTRINGDGIEGIVSHEFAQAGYAPAQMNTGAVIITGESSRKENAAVVLERLSKFAGDFVVSTAGPDLESIIAGKGSGAAQYSAVHGCTTVNLDIGGGTTNLALFHQGDIVSKGCFDIGGRLIGLQPDYTVTHVSPSAQTIAQSVGVRLVVGQKTTPEQIGRITDAMAMLLTQALGLLPPTALLAAVQTPNSAWFSTVGYPPQWLCFSGGVAECMVHPPDHPLAYGDIGAFLAQSIAKSTLCKTIATIHGQETIGATVVGAGIYTTTISGSTITCAPELLPLKNVPALKLEPQIERQCLAGQVGVLAQQITWFLEETDTNQLVLALNGLRDPSYEALQTVCRVLAMDLQATLPPGAPVLVVVKEDMAKALGLLLRQAFGTRRTVLCIDGIHVEQGDYIDFGRPIVQGMALPVVVKTLLFE